MNRKVLIPLAVALIAAAIAWGVLLRQPGEARLTQSDQSEGAPIVDVDLPDTLSAEAQVGQQVFATACIACHGAHAAGRQGLGPPLIHKTYEPGHHADMAFHLAVQNGVRAHHWRFGNMPRVEGLTQADVAAIVAYVREVQRHNGID